MKKAIVKTCLILSFYMYSCTAGHQYTIVQTYRNIHSASVGNYEKVKLEEILNSPRKYHNSKIEIQGYYDEDFEISCLYSSSKSMHSKKANSAIWIGFSYYDNLIDTITGNNLLKDYEERQHIQKKRILIQGVFNADFKGHDDLYPGALQKINLIHVYSKIDTSKIGDKKNHEELGNLNSASILRSIKIKNLAQE